MDTIKKIGKAMAKSKAKIIMIAFIIIFCTATIYAAAANTYTITIEIDGVASRVVTMRETADEILGQVGLEIGDNDILDLTDFTEGTDSVIRVYKSHSFTVVDNGGEPVSYNGNGSIGFALLENGIVLKDGDVVNYSVDEQIADGMEIVISRAYTVKIMADGETVDVQIAGGTVSDALDKAVITADDDDILSKPLDTPLEKDMLIKITRIEYKTRTQVVEIPFKTVTKKSAAMYTDQAKVEIAGVKGQQTVTYNEKFIDGELVESTQVSAVVDKKPVDEVKTVGTKKRVGATTGVILTNGKKTISTLTPPASLQLDKNNVPLSYKKKIVGTASAYSGGGLTATGKKVRPGYIAVNPKQIPYGTKMWIVSNDGRYIYGYASAEDTGGFTKWTGSRATLCDLYFSDAAAMNRFGRRSVTIYVL